MNLVKFTIRSDTTHKEAFPPDLEDRMFDHFATAQSEAQTGISPDLLAGLTIALIVTVVILRYMKVILYVAVFVMAAIVFAGIVQVEPLIAEIIANIHSATESSLGPQPGPAEPEVVPDTGLRALFTLAVKRSQAGSPVAPFDRG
jgi:hypothetical protein